MRVESGKVRTLHGRRRAATVWHPDRLACARPQGGMIEPQR